MLQNLRELHQYRALLWALTLRELEARYRASVLGFLWTFLNPTLNMVVYVVVFGYLMKSGVKYYPYYLFCGLLPWIYFSSSVIGGTSSISDRRDLLTKVRFPAQVLPATVITTNLINFLLSLPLLVLLGGYYGQWPTWHVVYAVPVVLVQTAFTLAITYLLSALNVAYRDIQHVVGNLVQMAFFLTPVLWPISNLEPETRTWVLYGNPLASIVSAWRDIFYEHTFPDPGPLLAVSVVSLVVMWLSTEVFARRREDFAELV
jgi:lipopolysaccharide transport system permease protein